MPKQTLSDLLWEAGIFDDPVGEKIMELFREQDCEHCISPYRLGLIDFVKKMKEEEKIMSGTSTWIIQEDVLFSMTCPNCNLIVMMSKEPLITRLKKWAKQLRNL